MSEVASRPAPARGRGSARGGRGGARGSTRGRDRPTNGTYSTKEASADDFITEQGELGEMKKQFSSQLPMLKELFQDWTEVDLLFALQETDGDLESTIERISEGHVSKFSDVKSTKEKAKPKAKEGSAEAATSTRAARGRGAPDASRATRGRGSERGRGGHRGGRGATHSTAPGSRAPATSTATGDSNAWGDSTATDGASSAARDGSTESSVKAAQSEPAKPKAPAEPPKKTWAQMFAKPAVPPPAPATQKPAPEAAPTSDVAVTPSETSDFVEVTHADAEPEETIPSATEDTPGHEPPQITEAEDHSIQIAPSKDQLTKENVEHLPDTAQPAPTGTAASTVESSRGPDSVTPSVSGQPIAQAPIGRPQLGGFQTTAYKATASGSRSASFNRRLMEQQEAVVMPGNHAVDRTAVQFGSLGLSGDALDVDEDREELETRAQPPQHSPVAQPRASLPPVPRQPAVSSTAAAAANTSTEASTQEAPATTKPAPGLPPAPASQQAFSQQSPSATASQAQPNAQAAQGYGQFGRYGQNDASAQKQYDPFGQQLPQQAGYGSFPNNTQAPEQSAQGLGGFSSSANDYSSYYTADQRNAYSNYYNSYGQQHSGAQQDAGASQQRTGSAFGAAGESGFPAAQASQISSRYGDNQSGHNTPNPTIGGQHAAGQGAAGHSHQPHAQHGGYPYQHPYYNSPYYSAYMNQYSPYAQQGFGGQFNKGGMYNQPHHGGYDQHSSSPAYGAGFGRDIGLGGGMGDYGRSGSAQPSQTAQSGATGAFGGNDRYSGFQGQASSYGSATQAGQQANASEDALKPFGDSKSGPSPSALGAQQQPGRPGSATNTSAQASSQSGLPPPQTHQQGAFGIYPGQHQQGFAANSQYGGALGGLGGHTAGAQQHSQGAYGSNYGAAGFGSNYGSYGRGGWGQNYGH
ncbi:uncharacterized protein PV09_01298 [Verruconis gallopava]|uniref:RNA polymerase II degradation factor 1 n=1 Tax=Verruconis gallopava TaxID=253628 RepID=A0A0D2BAN4_9PEZI|nr:uncharacterized protein PV09_01298 [Verruconis gallopava]KIW08384.1 hypothetical protein PV09_01298 [Verruconis gallopava]